MKTKIAKTSEPVCKTCGEPATKGRGQYCDDCRKGGKTKQKETKPTINTTMSNEAEKQFAITAAYSGLRNTGYSHEVAGAMLGTLGADAEQIRQAATAYGA